MSTHNLTIAKAAFTAACLGSDVTRLNRDEIASFHSTFETAIIRCSPTNIQNCKQWILVNILPSLQKSNALSKYLALYSKHIAGGGNATLSDKGVRPCRKVLHVLYLLNDLLHHLKHHDTEPSSRKYFTGSLRPHLDELFKNATVEYTTGVKKRLQDLLNIWNEERYFDREILDILRSVLSGSYQAVADLTSSAPPRTQPKELPFILPGTHGDSSTPYYDLPAANLMPHIIPNSSTPMRGDQIRALQLSAGPADESLVNAVKDFLNDVKRLEDPFISLGDECIVAETDQLGQMSYHNEADEIVTDTYYGWSREFCNKMKKRSQPRSSRRSRSRGSSMSRSRSPRKRQRYNSSSRSSRSRSRSAHQTRSRSSSSGVERPRLGVQETLRARDDHPRQTRPYDSSTLAFNMPPNVFPPPPLGSNGMPIPPPRPPNWHGPWPPPPPTTPFRSNMLNLPYPPDHQSAPS